MENNMSKKGVHVLKRLWYAFFFCSCIYFHGNIQAACLNSILTNYPNIILLFALSLVKVYGDKIKIGLNYSINTTEEHEPIKNYVFAETKEKEL